MPQFPVIVTDPMGENPQQFDSIRLVFENDGVGNENITDKVSCVGKKLKNLKSDMESGSVKYRVFYYGKWWQFPESTRLVDGLVIEREYVDTENERPAKIPLKIRFHLLLECFAHTPGIFNVDSKQAYFSQLILNTPQNHSFLLRGYKWTIQQQGRRPTPVPLGEHDWS